MDDEEGLSFPMPKEVIMAQREDEICVFDNFYDNGISKELAEWRTKHPGTKIVSIALAPVVGSDSHRTSCIIVLILFEEEEVPEKMA